ncbi:hypothetical protein BC826DRAFT_1168710 [Russula brevipes]|nr:hypothetical protein BC826DRAFT_1168710 [Russula brevipes]
MHPAAQHSTRVEGADANNNEPLECIAKPSSSQSTAAIATKPRVRPLLTPSPSNVFLKTRLPQQGQSSAMAIPARSSSSLLFQDAPHTGTCVRHCSGMSTGDGVGAVGGEGVLAGPGRGSLVRTGAKAGSASPSSPPPTAQYERPGAAQGQE